ncbi:MAG: ABC transporter permease subunit [Alphaproteobacteria bacterium]|nr:ABC transporter permease subunit [Alphaproteobacteria bacterium]
MFYNQKYRNVFFQICLIASIFGLAYWLVDNTRANLAQIGLDIGFDFWNQPAGFDIAFTLIDYNSATSTYSRVFFIGVLNTLFVSMLGIVAATSLGFVIAFLSLTQNLLARKIAGFYVEIFRNTPLLVQCVFWYFGVITALPSVRNSLNIWDISFINQRGMYFPKPLFSDIIYVVLIVALCCVAAAIILSWLNNKRQIKTGKRLPIFWINSAIMIMIPASLAWSLGLTVSWDIPVLQGFNFRGGILFPPELMALFLALTMYTSAYIAEIVRSGFLSVDFGQTEAAKALGLRQGFINKLIIIPQALRVIIPPLTNQYLNLIKNSSLAVAIGYPDLVSVFTGTTLNQTGRAIEIVLITMLFYLFVSLVISMLMNWYNRRQALVER